MNLKYLLLQEPSYKSCGRSNLDDGLGRKFRWSTLSYLSIKVQSLENCLCLLDGRLNQQSTYIVDVFNPYFMDEIQTSATWSKEGYPTESKVFFFIREYVNILLQ